MEEQHCAECQHFIRHYALNAKKIIRINCGHCILNYRKKKYPDTKACDKFIPGTSHEDAFASKEFLSKELLRYVLNLELLPEIEDKK